MKAKDGFVVREVAGEQVIMPTGENITKFEGAVILNEVAAYAYEELTKHPEGLDLDAIAAYITEGYEVDMETAKKDIAEAFGELCKYGIIEA